MTPSQLGDPLLSEHIVATLNGVVDGEEIPKALELAPMKLLSDYFPEPPVQRMLHLVVKGGYHLLRPAQNHWDLHIMSLISCHTSANHFAIFQ